jgi:GNAT superfamily N-acetyltransferase
MEPGDLTTRPAGIADVPRLAALVADGFGTYRDFAPPGWAPPPEDEHTEYLAAAVEDPDTWSMLAEQGAALAGHVMFMPAARSRVPVEDAGLAHFFQLFVAREWWGSGLATMLHGAAVAAARDRGYTTMRLFTPADQARARRFYEREGWVLETPPHAVEHLPFEMTEYHRAL